MLQLCGLFRVEAEVMQALVGFKAPMQALFGVSAAPSSPLEGGVGGRGILGAAQFRLRMLRAKRCELHTTNSHYTQCLPHKLAAPKPYTRRAHADAHALGPEQESAAGQ